MKKKYFNILLILLIIFILINIIKTLKLMGICCLFLSILSPLFFGYVLSWILKPIVDRVRFNRVVCTTIIYVFFIGLIVYLFVNLIPIVINQTKKIIPILNYYIIHNKYLYYIYDNLNIKDIFKNSINSMNDCINNIFKIGINVVYSMIFGFYFLIRKNSISYFKFIPDNLRINISKDLRSYIKSIILDTMFMFVILSISFSIIRISNPILFAFFCSVTNIIPYVGPYIGSIPAILIGLTNSFRIGLIVCITIIVVQALENNIIQPLIVSKNVNLNPIYILIGVIIFSYFFGILGMIISTPILLIIKNIINYYKKNKPKWFIKVLDKL